MGAGAEANHALTALRSRQAEFARRGGGVGGARDGEDLASTRLVDGGAQDRGPPRAIRASGLAGWLQFQPGAHAPAPGVEQPGPRGPLQ